MKALRLDLGRELLVDLRQHVIQPGVSEKLVVHGELPPGSMEPEIEAARVGRRKSPNVFMIAGGRFRIPPPTVTPNRGESPQISCSVSPRARFNFLCITLRRRHSRSGVAISLEASLARQRIQVGG
jgi:hypothetical protein